MRRDGKRFSDIYHGDVNELKKETRSDSSMIYP